MPQELREVDKFVQEVLPDALRRSADLREEMQTIDSRLQETTYKRRIDTPGASNIVIPLTRSQRKHARTRLYEATAGNSPVARLRPTKGASESEDIDWYRATREGTEFLSHMFGMTEELDGRNVTRSLILEFVDYGLCVLKILPDVSETGGPVWELVSLKDILWPEGMGMDIKKLPWWGHIFHMNKFEVRAATEEFEWDSEAVDKIIGLSDSEVEEAAKLFLGDTDHISKINSREYDRNSFAEFWVPDEEGEEQVVVIHIRTGTIMASRPAPISQRPFFVARLDERSSLSFLGTGLPKELEGVQEVINAIYNGAIDMINAALQQVRLIRADSGLAETLGAGDQTVPIGPNFQAITENPEADLNVVALGEARAVAPVLAMTGDIKEYAFDLFGLSSAQTGGDVSQTRRAPATGVAAVLNSGSFPIRDASRRLGEMFEDAVKFTLEMYRTGSFNKEIVTQILGDQGEAFKQVLESESDLRDTLSIEIEVANPTSSGDAEAQAALFRSQFVMQWYDRLGQLAQFMANPQIPEPIQRALVEVAAKSEELIRRALEAADDIQDPEAILVDVNETFGRAMEETQKLINPQAALQQEQQAGDQPPEEESGPAASGEAENEAEQGALPLGRG